MRNLIYSVFTALLIIFNANATEYGFKNILISNPWARTAPVKNSNSAIYMEIINNSEHNDTLIKAETEISTKVEIHKTVTLDKISSMVAIDKVMIPAHTTVKFAPKGLHIMIMGLNKELIENDKFNLSLTFEKAGKVDVEVIVKKPKLDNVH
jgi:copper(I)-binding protein